MKITDADEKLEASLDQIRRQTRSFCRMVVGLGIVIVTLKLVEIVALLR